MHVVHFLETAQKVHHACGALFGNSTKSAPCKCPFISSAPKVYRYVRVVLLLFHIKCTNTPVNFWCGFAQAAPKAFQYVCVASVLSHMECTQIRKYCCSLELVANQGPAPASFGLLNKKVRTHVPALARAPPHAFSRCFATLSRQLWTLVNVIFILRSKQWQQLRCKPPAGASSTREGAFYCAILALPSGKRPYRLVCST